MNERIQEEWKPLLQHHCPDAGEYQLKWMSEYCHNFVIREHDGVPGYARAGEGDKFPSLLPMSIGIIKNSSLLPLVEVIVTDKSELTNKYRNCVSIPPSDYKIGDWVLELESMLLQKITNELDFAIYDVMVKTEGVSVTQELEDIHKLISIGDSNKFLIASIANGIKIQNLKEFKLSPIESCSPGIKIYKIGQLGNIDVYINGNLKYENTNILIGSKPDKGKSIFKVILYCLADAIQTSSEDISIVSKYAVTRKEDNIVNFKIIN